MTAARRRASSMRRRCRFSFCRIRRWAHIAIGDIVIGHLKTGQGERLVYGFAAETGPPGQFGEGSYAFARMLRGDVPESPMNVTDVYKADIGPSWLRANGASLSILALGGTKALLRDDYLKTKCRARRTRGIREMEWRQRRRQPAGSMRASRRPRKTRRNSALCCCLSSKSWYSQPPSSRAPAASASRAVWPGR